MPRRDTNPPELHPAPGFSHVTEAAGARMVHFAGQVALDREFGIVGGDDLLEADHGLPIEIDCTASAA